MTEQIPNLPALATLSQVPSWVNACGWVDRSACIEIRVSEARRLAGCVIIDRSQRDSRGRALHITAPLPDERPARLVSMSAGGSTTGGRVAAGTVTITAQMLWELHMSRPPRRLAGDYRTARANVMRAGGEESPNGQTAKVQSGRFRLRIPHNGVAYPPDVGLDDNPNRGASRSKFIGLFESWSQRVTIEQWVYPRRIRPAYFFVCPGGQSQQGNKSTSQNGHGAAPGEFHHGTRGTHGTNGESGSRRVPNQVEALSASSARSAVSLSSRKPGREHPSSRKCPQRCLKLLMVQCSAAEWRDAKLAAVWLSSLPESLARRPAYREMIGRLLARYGELLTPSGRMLVCPRCVGRPRGGSGTLGDGGPAAIPGVGVRYGNNPETTRQSWRRRNNKPDTSVEGAMAQTVRDTMGIGRLLDLPAAELERPENLEPLRKLALKRAKE